MAGDLKISFLDSCMRSSASACVQGAYPRWPGRISLPSMLQVQREVLVGGLGPQGHVPLFYIMGEETG